MSAAISLMGHTDTIVIGDAGLPIPDGVERIDLAVCEGTPDFITVLRAVLSELQIERFTLAEEISSANADMEKAIFKVIADDSRAAGKVYAQKYVTHEKFKEMTRTAKAVIRTGECTPYANIILQSGVVF